MTPIAPFRHGGLALQMRSVQSLLQQLHASPGERIRVAVQCSAVQCSVAVTIDGTAAAGHLTSGLKAVLNIKRLLLIVKESL